MKKISKAIFPVAGLGTRFLPATKASPKEMLPIVDKPLIQYAVEEAIAAGITELIFVTSSSKRAIEDHFDSNYELEAKLAEAGKNDLLQIVKNILPKGVSCIYLRQPDTLGLGHAVLCAQPLIDNEPFAILLADDLIDSSVSCLKQMLTVYQEKQHSVIAVQAINPEGSDQYGIIGYKAKENRLSLIDKIIEKPSIKEAPSNLAVVGRYILTSAIFPYLAKIPPGKGGEIQLTDAIACLLENEPLYAWEFEGTRYDCGSKLGYLHATIAYALKHSETKTAFANYLKNFKL
ncbi:UTP--glucose-1-phosphate uridylyltransferase GalU [Rickettsiella endosymbiont of Dermanyssus gallinae]|uniref:UTP--glucose-1-phosphate uridylyltransferase GalU n=1 Tax=Rickettsiella endosymbiont of Dermanyssus gallinae TaxID=2856608 RepID=UPI001C529C38|nr:UTP--glucose-1-phosphate uridylyltransferase GalU [Rickettsiella endosymbiont of Dermanyssus gallinae]